MGVAGFVLVGGHSRRMGRDKARLPLPSHLLIEEVAARVSCVAENLALVGESRRYRDLGFDCIDDLHPSLGPIAGIESALASGRGDLNIIVACDLPGLQSKWLAELLAQARNSNASCVVCQDSSGRIQPLCGIWRSNCLSAVQQALTLGRLRLLDLVGELNAEILPVDQLIPNVNTPRDWTAWLNNRAGDSQVPARKAAARG